MVCVWANSHSMIPVDGTDLIKIIQSKFSSAGHLITINRCQNVILAYNKRKKLKINVAKIIETLIYI